MSSFSLLYSVMIFSFKETDILKQGQRQAASIKSNLETKLARASEENERIKTEMRQIKQTSKVSSFPIS